jgi:hypothetical protein
MKMKFILSLAAAAVFAAVPAIAQEGHDRDKAEASATPAAGQKYTCTMHPEVVQDKPGKCPKCGMKLVPKEDSGKSK